MLFRKRLFTILACLCLLWIAYGCTTVNRVTDKQLQTQQVQTSSAAQAGTLIGASIGLTIFLCTGVPLFFLFALLAWRNGVGITNKKRHEETIAALHQKE